VIRIARVCGAGVPYRILMSHTPLKHVAHDLEAAMRACTESLRGFDVELFEDDERVKVRLLVGREDPLGARATRMRYICCWSQDHAVVHHVAGSPERVYASWIPALAPNNSQASVCLVRTLFISTSS